MTDTTKSQREITALREIAATAADRLAAKLRTPGVAPTPRDQELALLLLTTVLELPLMLELHRTMDEARMMIQELKETPR